MKNIILHPGMAKCASTSLQRLYRASDDVRVFRLKFRPTMDAKGNQKPVVRKLFTDGDATSADLLAFTKAVTRTINRGRTPVISAEGITSYTRLNWKQKRDLVEKNLVQLEALAPYEKKCFLMVRDPWRLFRSGYLHQVVHKKGKALPLETYLAAHVDRVEKGLSYFQLADLITAYRDLFGADNVMVGSLETMAPDADSFARDLAGFFDVGPFDAKQLRHKNKTANKLSPEVSAKFEEDMAALRAQNSAGLARVEDEVARQSEKLAAMRLDLFPDKASQEPSAT